MFSADLIRAIRYFENENLQLDSNIMSRCSRIDMLFPDFYQAQAIGSLFKLCNPSKDYDFLFKKQEANKNRGVVTILADPTETGKKVDSVFMSTLKKILVNFSNDLSQSWGPYSSNNEDNDFYSDLMDIQQYETAISKKSKDGTYAIYYYLNKLNGGKVTLGTSDESDQIAGSKKEVEEFLNCLKTVGEEVQKELG